MRGNHTRRRIEWFTSAVHPKRMIASPTLAALRALLSGLRSESRALARSTPCPASVGRPSALLVPLEDVPGLQEVGGVAVVAADGGETVGVARVGRTSFVGFKLDGDTLREIEVELDESRGSLCITPAVAYPGPRVS
jgi:hypothetical protein